MSEYELVSLDYSTVRDYTRYWEEHSDLIGERGALKDVQRPWVLETVDDLIPGGSFVADMGGAACDLASCLAQNYRVTVVDPYDGRGNGPTRVEVMKKRHPTINFIIDTLNPDTDIDQEYHAVVSTSVIEHIPVPHVGDAVEGIDRALISGGYSIHAIDFSVRGNGRIMVNNKHCLEAFVSAYGLDPGVVEELRNRMIEDCETYYLSAPMYQQWRRKRDYDEYPWRQVGTLNIVLKKA